MRKRRSGASGPSTSTTASTSPRPGVRCNLGAAAGDGFSDEPYLYVGPWDALRPGSADYWNAPFGAVLGYDDLDAAADPLGRAIEFLLAGITQLRSG